MQGGAPCCDEYGIEVEAGPASEDVKDLYGEFEGHPEGKCGEDCD